MCVKNGFISMVFQCYMVLFTYIFKNENKNFVCKLSLLLFLIVSIERKSWSLIPYSISSFFSLHGDIFQKAKRKPNETDWPYRHHSSAFYFILVHKIIEIVCLNVKIKHSNGVNVRMQWNTEKRTKANFHYSQYWIL